MELSWFESKDQYSWCGLWYALITQYKIDGLHLKKAEDAAWALVDIWVLEQNRKFVEHEVDVGGSSEPAADGTTLWKNMTSCMHSCEWRNM